MCSASSSVVPTGTVIRFVFVITSPIGRSVRDTNRRSRFVKIPTSFLLFVTGTPEILYRRITSSAAWIGSSGEIVTGSTIIPLSLRFTLSISPACASIVRFRCTTPIPPCCAIAIASRDSVTVSIAALISGQFSVIRFVSLVCVLTCVGTTSL